jgi:two-component system, OmpR family, phosphate regulon sensor histidine kinase PhoR
MKYQLAKEKFRVVLDVGRGHGRKPRGAFVINADTDAIREVLLNLLTNAMKYSDDVKRIRIAVGRTRQTITCAIEDYGRGIPPEAMSHLFEKFYRDPSLPKRIQGVGLGLSVVKHVMDAHGGKILVHSTPGKGSTFTLEFPLARSVQSAA